MTTLKELNELSSKASGSRLNAERAKRTQDRLAAIRTAETPLTIWMETSGRYANEDMTLIKGVINEFSSDLLRVLELRQEAIARKHSADAALAKAQLESLVTPEVTS